MQFADVLETDSWSVGSVYGSYTYTKKYETIPTSKYTVIINARGLLKLIFLQEVALDDNHNRIGDVLRVRRKEKRYIESINPPLDPFETIRLS